MRAVIILSGGLDSTTCMGIAKDAGYDLYPVTFDYGQRHRIEIENARKVAEFYNVPEHKVLSLGFLKEFGGSALTDETISLPKVEWESGGEQMEDHQVADRINIAESTEIPVTYVPGRNLLFLSVAASYAEVIAAEAIYIGVNALDYSGYPDCRPDFIRQVEKTIGLATKVGAEGKPISIQTPLIEMTKAEIIQTGIRLGVPYELTTSCYNGAAAACGECDSCRLRIKGFREAGEIDPVPYKREVRWN